MTYLTELVDTDLYTLSGVGRLTDTNARALLTRFLPFRDEAEQGTAAAAGSQKISDTRAWEDSRAINAGTMLPPRVSETFEARTAVIQIWEGKVIEVDSKSQAMHY